MSAAVAMQPPKLQEKTDSGGGLWSKLKKSINLKDQDDNIVVRKKTGSSSCADFHQVYNQAVSQQRKSEGAIQQPCSSLNGHSKPANPKHSLRMVQLELANHDHENNLLNSKPVPKKSSSLQDTSQQRFNGSLQKRPSVGILRGNSGELHFDKDLRRSSTLAAIGMEHSRSFRPSSQNSGSSRESDPNLPSKAAFSVGSRKPSLQPQQTNGDPSVTTGRSLWGKIRQQYAPTAAKLADEPPTPKLAQFAQLWDVVFQTVQENDMLEMEEPDPKLWWKKVFLNMKRRHGKGQLLY